MAERMVAVPGVRLPRRSPTPGPGWARQGQARQGTARSGSVQQVVDRLGRATARHGGARARKESDWQAPRFEPSALAISAWPGRAGLGDGSARLGAAGQGEGEWHTPRFESGAPTQGQGRTGQCRVGPGVASQGKAREVAVMVVGRVRLPPAARTARSGRALRGEVRLGRARLGTARHGKGSTRVDGLRCGSTPHHPRTARHGKARPGKARRSEARHGKEPQGGSTDGTTV
jgi:hypothetical protein